MNLRIERRIEAEQTYVVSVEVSEDASPIELAIAVRSLNKIAVPLAQWRCPACFAPVGIFHDPLCPDASSDEIVEMARVEAGLA